MSGINRDRVAFVSMALALLLPLLAAADRADAAEVQPAGSRALRHIVDPGTDDWRSEIRRRATHRFDSVLLVTSPVVAAALGVPLILSSIPSPSADPLVGMATPLVLVFDAFTTVGLGLAHAGLGYAYWPAIRRDAQTEPGLEAMAQRWTGRARTFGILGVVLMGTSVVVLLAAARFDPANLGPGHLLTFGIAMLVPASMTTAGIACAELAREARSLEEERQGKSGISRRPGITAVGPFAVAGIW